MGQLVRESYAMKFFALLLPVVLAALGCQEKTKHVESGAMLLPGFANNYHWPIDSSSADAQKWFDQGMQLLYGFNQEEAIRSFEEAARHDPECALIWWAIGYAYGPQLHNPETTRKRLQRAREAIQQAGKFLSTASPENKALIHALKKRYSAIELNDQIILDQEYAKQMESVWRDHPENADIGALYASALMYLQFSDYWTQSGEPKGRTSEIVGVLEKVLDRHPTHTGANHYYIHTVEASPHPEWAVAAADRLVTLVPGSGHLLHMPSHIYIRLGRYAEAAEVNERAIAVDKLYLSQAPPSDMYRILSFHNFHFLVYVAMMEGRYEAAMATAQKLKEEIGARLLRNHARYCDGLHSTYLHVLVRFGRWSDIVEEPEPHEFCLFSKAIWHYTRGVAYAATGHLSEARSEREAFEQCASRIPEDWLMGTTRVQDLIPVARQMLSGEIAYREGHHDEAFTLLRKGVELEDALLYSEPPGWMQPVRHALGALLMESGRLEEAESVFNEDLKRHPGNGWSLSGLERIYSAQNRDENAKNISSMLENWRNRADVWPDSSCYCERLKEDTGKPRPK